MFAALGCEDTTTKELFEVLSAREISDALQSQDVMNSSTPIERALLFDMSKHFQTIVEALSLWKRPG